MHPNIPALILETIPSGRYDSFDYHLYYALETLLDLDLISSTLLASSPSPGKYCFGVDDTLKALEMGAVETLIGWENLDTQRYVLKNHSTGEEKILFLSSGEKKRKEEPTCKSPQGS